MRLALAEAKTREQARQAIPSASQGFARKHSGPRKAGAKGTRSERALTAEGSGVPTGKEGGRIVTERLLTAVGGVSEVSRPRSRQRRSRLRPRTSALSRVSRGTNGPASCRSRGSACGRTGSQRCIPIDGRMATARSKASGIAPQSSFAARVQHVFHADVLLPGRRDPGVGERSASPARGDRAGDVGRRLPAMPNQTGESANPPHGPMMRLP